MVQQWRGINADQIQSVPSSINACDLRQLVDFRSINLAHIERVPNVPTERLSGIIAQALDASPAGSVLNIVMRGPPAESDVQTVLNLNNAYNVARETTGIRPPWTNLIHKSRKIHK